MPTRGRHRAFAIKRCKRRHRVARLRPTAAVTRCIVDAACGERRHRRRGVRRRHVTAPGRAHLSRRGPVHPASARAQRRRGEQRSRAVALRHAAVVARAVRDAAVPQNRGVVRQVYDRVTARVPVASTVADVVLNTWCDRKARRRQGGVGEVRGGCLKSKCKPLEAQRGPHNNRRSD